MTFGSVAEFSVTEGQVEAVQAPDLSLVSWWNIRQRWLHPRTRFFAVQPRLLYPVVPPPPSDLSWVQQNPIVRRKPTAPRTRRYFVEIRRPLQYRTPPWVYPVGTGFALPLVLVWKPAAHLLRKPMKPRKRFRVKGKWPMLPAHVISYTVMPSTQWVLVGPGRVKKRGEKPSLETGRAVDPRLQK